MAVRRLARRQYREGIRKGEGTGTGRTMMRTTTSPDGQDITAVRRPVQRHLQEGMRSGVGTRTGPGMSIDTDTEMTNGQSCSRRSLAHRR